MKVRTRLYLAGTLFSILFMAIFIYFNITQRQSFIELFKFEAKEKEGNFEKIMLLKGKALENFVYDYSYWDEMVDFIKNINMSWARDMIGQSVLTNYNIDAIWIYNLDHQLLYSVNNVNDNNLQQLPLGVSLIDNLFSDRRFAHFFINTTAGLTEIRGATVHPTNDPQRKTPPQGYIFAAKLWNKKYIDELANLSGGKVGMSAIKDRMPLREFIPQLGTIAFSRTLTDWENRPLIRIDIKFVSKEIREFNRMLRLHFIFFVIFALSALVMVLFLITRWVNMPLRNISNALNSNNPSYIDTLRNNGDEFGEISRLIEDFLKQEKALEESEGRYRLLAENAIDIIWTADMNMHFTYFSYPIAYVKKFVVLAPPLNECSAIANRRH